LGVDLAFLERYAGSALDTLRIPNAREFAVRYGEIANVVPYTHLRSDQTVQQVFELYHRHAGEVHQTMQSILLTHSEAVIHQSYPPCTFLGVIVGRTSRRQK